MLGVILLTVLLIACSREEQQTAGPASPLTATPESAVAATTAPAVPPAAGAVAASTPRLEPADCATFNVDDGQGDHPVRCHYLVVPENRERPTGATLRLAVAIFAAADAPPGEPPLIWLDGGPGGESVEQVASVITGPAGRLILPGGRSLVADRDLILIDQRGTGQSQPSLACPEITPLDQPGRDPGVSASESGQVRLNAALACRDRIAAAGIDLAAYTSRENAADINDLRIALGHAQVNLYGVSYGSRLALTVMRDFPGTVRSAVLDSPVPLQVDLFTGALTGAQRALDLIFDGCDADPDCRATYPSLRDTFHSLISRLNTEPITFTNLDPATRERKPAILTGDDLIGAMFDLLYVTPAIPLFPAIIGNLERGNIDGFILILRGIAESGGLNYAMHYSVQCSDEVPFAVPNDQQAAAGMVHPQLARALGPAFGERMRAICAAWPSHPAAPVENEPVTSTVPTLILSGQHDPITPPTYAEIAASTLPNSTAVTFPGVAHGALLSTRTCPYDITWAFLRDPATRPDTSCVAEMKDPDWVVSR